MRGKYIELIFICVFLIFSSTLQSKPINYRIDMKKNFIAVFALLAINLVGISHSVAAPTKFIGTDYSGVYTCKGSNAKVGNYDLTVTLTLNKSNSFANLGHYNMSVQAGNAAAYSGQAIAKGNEMAMTIKFTDGKQATYSTGMAKFKRVYGEDRHFSYTNEYYESEQSQNGNADRPGNFGSEECMQNPGTP
jgi:hypothetical protein